MKRAFPIGSLIRSVILRKGISANELAKRIGVNHTTVSRWLSGKFIPNAKSCAAIATYSEMTVDEVLLIAGYISNSTVPSARALPDFRQYARVKYPKELDEDLITMVEHLISLRRQRQGNEG